MAQISVKLFRLKVNEALKFIRPETKLPLFKMNEASLETFTELEIVYVNRTLFDQNWIVRLLIR